MIKKILFNKKALMCFIAVFSVLFIFTGTLSCIYLNEPHSATEAETNYKLNKRYISTVKDYMTSLPYEYVSISDVDYIFPEDGKYGTYYAGNEDGGTEGKIEDEKVLKAIDTLLTFGRYDSITKNGNIIEFHIWSTGDDRSGGIVFSSDGSTPQIEFQTKLEPLSMKNWYYYETDFQKFKEQKESGK